jgi:hypothetical protein
MAFCIVFNFYTNLSEHPIVLSLINFEKYFYKSKSKFGFAPTQAIKCVSTLVQYI